MLVPVDGLVPVERRNTAHDNLVLLMRSLGNAQDVSSTHG